MNAKKSDQAQSHQILKETIPPEPEGVEDKPEEIGGRKGLEPTRFGDWEKNGRCIDF